MTEQRVKKFTRRRGADHAASDPGIRAAAPEDFTSPLDPPWTEAEEPERTPRQAAPHPREDDPRDDDPWIAAEASSDLVQRPEPAPAPVSQDVEAAPDQEASLPQRSTRLSAFARAGRAARAIAAEDTHLAPLDRTADPVPETSGARAATQEDDATAGAEDDVWGERDGVFAHSEAASLEAAQDAVPATMGKRPPTEDRTADNGSKDDQAGADQEEQNQGEEDCEDLDREDLDWNEPDLDEPDWAQEGQAARQLPSQGQSEPARTGSVPTDPAPARSVPPGDNAADAEPAQIDAWTGLRQVTLERGNPRQGLRPLVDFFRKSPTARGFDLLRTRLLSTLRDRGWRRVALCAPTSGCGATFTAVNLALSLGRVPALRTVLMDLDLRSPSVAAAMGLEQATLYNGDMRGFLAQEIDFADHFVAPSSGLALGLNKRSSENAAEILQEARSGAAIERMLRQSRADVVIFDLPPVLEQDDLAAFLPQVDGVLLVSDATRTTAADLRACEKLIASHAELLGVVLNRAQDRDARHP